MRIEARDGLLDSSGGEVEQTELAHHPQSAPHAGSAPRVSPCNGTSGETHALTQPKVTLHFLLCQPARGNHSDI